MNIELIDSVLAYFYANASERFTVINISENCLEGNLPAANMIIRKLHKDEFIDYTPFNMGRETAAYQISFEGGLFYESGGYVKLAKSKATERTLTKTEKVLLLVSAGIGAIGSIGILIFEMWKYSHPSP